MHQTGGYVTEALRAGALGYVVKSAGASELLEAIDRQLESEQLREDQRATLERERLDLQRELAGREFGQRESEFGRRLRENANGGTDHGHGSVMLALGGSVNGGQIYGTWPGLHADQLYDHADLDVTTDYRRVLSDILTRRLGNPNLDFVFPGYTGYQPMGIVRETPPPTPPPDLPYRIFLPTVSRC